MLRRPVALLTIGVVSALVMIEWSLRGVTVGLAGALIGMLAGLAAIQLGMLVGALALGVRVHQVVIGIGNRVREWSPHRSTVVLKSLPVLLSVSVGPGKAPAHRRMRGAALVSALSGIAAAGAAVWAGVVERPSPGVGVTIGGAGTAGLALGASVTVAKALWPSQTGASTSTGWLLFRRLSQKQQARLAAAPDVLRAVDAVQSGNLAAANRITDDLLARHPDLRTVRAARIFVLEATGRYAEGLALALKMTSADADEPRELAQSMAGFANLACLAVEAGELDAEIGLPAATRAVEHALALGRPSYQLDGVRALMALLRDEPEQAVRLARTAVALNDDHLGRADDLATLAKAYMAAGDNRSARVALAEAEGLAPWWPRVVLIRGRLDLA